MYMKIMKNLEAHVDNGIWSSGNGNLIGVIGTREGRGNWYRVVMVIEGGQTGFFGMLGQRRGTPRWADDPEVEAEKDDSGGGGTLDYRRMGWGGYNT